MERNLVDFSSFTFPTQISALRFVHKLDLGPPKWPNGVLVGYIGGEKGQAVLAIHEGSHIALPDLSFVEIELEKFVERLGLMKSETGNAKRLELGAWHCGRLGVDIGGTHIQTRYEDISVDHYIYSTYVQGIWLNIQYWGYAHFEIRADTEDFLHQAVEAGKRGFLSPSR
jgi:hypothetical protein